ncbi:MAG: class A beta-lactamase-related serine hydrolase [Cytophagia bacterium]|nr:class A beta-lactamase-related serine hydrolase [Cytophagia bacterium]
MRYLPFSLFLFLLLACDKKEDPAPVTLYFPPNSGNWESTSPASLGWDVNKLAALNDFLVANNTRAFIILKDGKIVVEEYYGKQFDNVTNFSATSNWYWASAGKTLTSVLAGIAEEQGLLNFDARTSDYLGTGWTSLSLAQENKITVRHQLTMTTGLDDGVANPDCTTPACLVYKAEPGTRWAYHNAAYTLLDGVLANSTGKTLNTFVNDQLKSKIGMDGQYIQTGDNNVYYSTARSMARFGLLLLNKGKWNDVQVVTADYVDLLSRSSQNLNLSYGYLTWLNGKSSFMAPGSQLVIPSSVTPAAPADMFAAMGKNGQVINIVPSQNLIVVRMGDAPDNTLVPFLFQDDIWEKLNEIIVK